MPTFANLESFPAAKRKVGIFGSLKIYLTSIIVAAEDGPPKELSGIVIPDFAGRTASACTCTK